MALTIAKSKTTLAPAGTVTKGNFEDRWFLARQFFRKFLFQRAQLADHVGDIGGFFNIKLKRVALVHQSGFKLGINIFKTNSFKDGDRFGEPFYIEIIKELAFNLIAQDNCA